MKNILLRVIAAAILASGSGCYCTSACRVRPPCVDVRTVPPEGFVVPGAIFRVPPAGAIMYPNQPAIVQPAQPNNPPGQRLVPIPVPPTPLDEKEKIGPLAPASGTSNVRVRPELIT